MASALLLDKGLSAKSHGGLIHLIGSQFVTKGLLDKTYGRLFSRLYELRQSGDYTIWSILHWHPLLFLKYSVQNILKKCFRFLSCDSSIFLITCNRFQLGGLNNYS